MSKTQKERLSDGCVSVFGWLHLSLDVVLIAISLALAVYSLGLLNRFYKKSVFEEPFKDFLGAGLLHAGGTLFDIFQ